MFMMATYHLAHYCNGMQIVKNVVYAFFLTIVEVSYFRNLLADLFLIDHKHPQTTQNPTTAFVQTKPKIDNCYSCVNIFGFS
jgi:Ni,Fe-hydrogenase I cytochrome b subunit